eukprot:scaffold3166_cov20-Prasinocladus_malaysianus.AAC.1
MSSDADNGFNLLVTLGHLSRYGKSSKSTPHRPAQAPISPEALRRCWAHHVTSAVQWNHIVDA